MSVLIQFRIRRDTATNWSTLNPTLASGELGHDTTNNILKVGDGTSTWNQLSSINLNIPNDFVTWAKLQNFSTNSRLLGSSSNSSEPQEIQLGAGLNLSGNLLTATGGNIGLTVRNQTGNTIPAGAAVYISGASGQVPLVSLAQANNYATTEVIGLTSEAIANNSTGIVIMMGQVVNLNTNGFTQGASLYLSPTVPGGLTMVEPESPNFQVQIGWVEYAHPSNGEILVRVDNEFTKTEYIADSTATGRSLLTAATPAAARTTLELGSAALKNAPNSGVNATTTQVVMGDDTRLTDARTPLAHTHLSADVTNFSTSVDTIITVAPLDGGSF